MPDPIPTSEPARASLTLELPLPPSTNRLHRHARRGPHLAPEVRAWRAEAGWRIREARAAALPQGWWASHVAIPAPMLGDVDNRLKALHDLLVEHRVVPDDRWQWSGAYERDPSLGARMTRVRVWSLGLARFEADAAWRAACGLARLVAQEAAR